MNNNLPNHHRRKRQIRTIPGQSHNLLQHRHRTRITLPNNRIPAIERMHRIHREEQLTVIRVTTTIPEGQPPRTIKRQPGRVFVFEAKANVSLTADVAVISPTGCSSQARRDRWACRHRSGGYAAQRDLESVQSLVPFTSPINVDVATGLSFVNKRQEMSPTLVSESSRPARFRPRRSSQMLSGSRGENRSGGYHRRWGWQRLSGRNNSHMINREGLAGWLSVLCSVCRTVATSFAEASSQVPKTTAFPFTFRFAWSVIRKRDGPASPLLLTIASNPGRSNSNAGDVSAGKVAPAGFSLGVARVPAPIPAVVGLMRVPSSNGLSLFTDPSGAVQGSLPAPAR